METSEDDENALLEAYNEYFEACELSNRVHLCFDKWKAIQTR